MTLGGSSVPLARSAAYVQGSLGREKPCTTDPAQDDKVELPWLLRHAATEICLYRTSATFNVGAYPIEVDEGVS